MFIIKDLILLIIAATLIAVVASAEAEVITKKLCDKKKEVAEFIVEVSYFATEEEMRRLFPRHAYIIHQIYNTEHPEYIVPNTVYKTCLRDAVV